MSKVAYSLDLLFATDNDDEPGSMQVKVMAPMAQIRLTAVVEVRHGVSIRKNVGAILSALQNEILNRIQVDARDAGQAAIYFVVGEGQRHEFSDAPYAKLVVRDGADEFETAEELDL
ncbi:MAG: hypothetical protein LBU58_09680 [Clostridiales bacterium]|jgi:hypothetical protein|nr:hypothetical protein [Clostridiales bacterium]